MIVFRVILELVPSKYMFIHILCIAEDIQMGWKCKYCPGLFTIKWAFLMSIEKLQDFKTE